MNRKSKIEFIKAVVNGHMKKRGRPEWICISWNQENIEVGECGQNNGKIFPWSKDSLNEIKSIIWDYENVLTIDLKETELTELGLKSGHEINLNVELKVRNLLMIVPASKEIQD